MYLHCFRYLEFWSLGVIEPFEDFLLVSQSTKLPIAKARKVLLQASMFDAI